MKVLHVLNSRVYSGAEKVVSQIIHSFEETDVRMVYCSPESDMVREMLARQNIRYHSIPSLTPQNLKAVIREEQPDLIHAHDMRAGFVSALCCGRIPMVSHIHNNAFDARGLSVKSIAYLLAGWKARHILWVSQSAYEGYVFHKLFEKKSSVLRNIIDVREVQEKKEQDSNTYHYDLIYVGRLTQEKNPQRLMRLCAQMKQRRKNLKAAVVGSGELEGELKALCRELDIVDNVDFLGFQSNPMKMIHDSKVLILTSYWEGTPMCVLEAMALGTPVVSTSSDGMQDLITNGVNGYLSNEDRELAEYVLRIVEDGDLRRRLSANALKRAAADNDPENYQNAIRAVYHI